MTASLNALVPPGSEAGPGLLRLRAVAWRYFQSTAGLVAHSAAHFIAALIFLRSLPAADFGLFSFVLVVVPFALSISTALITVPVATRLRQPGGLSQAERDTCFKLNLLLGAAATLTTFIALWIAGAPGGAALLFGLYGGAMTLRWFARGYSYIEGRVVAVLLSDLLYAGLLVGGLCLLLLGHLLTLQSAATMLVGACLAALSVFGKDYFRVQWQALRTGRLALYAVLWRDLTRWSLLGVVFTEIAGNAHAYLVTFISGPKAFALLALGTLLMRPISLVQSALPDLERPAMARAIAARDTANMRRIVSEFTGAVGAVWLVTVALSAALLIWFPQIILKNGYDRGEVAAVVILFALIMALRTLRTPLAVFLQAAGEFKALAGIGWLSGSTSVLATLGLLLAFGPIASLGGILLGDIVTLAQCAMLVRGWRAAHG